MTNVECLMTNSQCCELLPIFSRLLLLAYRLLLPANRSFLPQVVAHFLGLMAARAGDCLRAFAACYRSPGGLRYATPGKAPLDSFAQGGRMNGASGATGCSQPVLRQ